MFLGLFGNVSACVSDSRSTFSFPFHYGSQKLHFPQVFSPSAIRVIEKLVSRRDLAWHCAFAYFARHGANISRLAVPDAHAIGARHTRTLARRSLVGITLHLSATGSRALVMPYFSSLLLRVNKLRDTIEPPLSLGVSERGLIWLLVPFEKNLSCGEREREREREREKRALSGRTICTSSVSRSGR